MARSLHIGGGMGGTVLGGWGLLLLGWNMCLAWDNATLINWGVDLHILEREYVFGLCS